MNLQESIRRILREDKYDDKVGRIFWFEYHCYESPESCDSEIWYRSHQKVKVIGVSEWSFDDYEDRMNDGQPRVYLVEWKDGFQYDVFEDELLESPNEFYRPNPPKRKIQESIRKILMEEKKKERTHYHQYKLGDVIDGSKLDELSGGLVGNDNNQYVLVQYPLYKFPYTRQDLIDFDPEYAEEEILRLESIKDNFDKTPPIPQEGDGLHRIIAAKELGYKTILMWKKIMNIQESIRRVLREEITEDKNLYGEKLKMCSKNPITGFYRDGYCRTGDDDTGSHTVCAKVTEEFLEFTNSMGNNLDMLEPGDKWCLCAMRWKEAKDNGINLKVDKSATNIKTIDILNSSDEIIESEITERCWKGYTQKGMKTMFGKRYPNCVKKKK